MKVIKKILGKLVYGIARGISAVMNTLIQLIETAVLLIKGFSKGCLTLISMGGCLFVILLAGPLGFRILTDPAALFTILFLMIFPIVGAKLISYLEYLKYILTEYLFNLANFLKDDVNYKFIPLNEYKKAYRRAEEERIRQEQRRYYEQQKEWEERIRQWQEQSFRGGHGNFGSYGSYGGQGNTGQGFVNPYIDFKNKYEKSCDILGVPYTADKNQIKLAYRRKAKKYHPDVNKASNATQMFQQVSDAYEFLNEDNIQRYKNIQ